MSYRTILVHLNDERRMMRLLKPAITLAEHWNAHVIAASALPPLYVLPVGAPGITDPIVIDEHRKSYQKEAARIEAAVREATAGRALVAEWRLEDAKSRSVASCIGALARCADLVIASQTDSNWQGSYFQDVAERLITESGRPVLLMPNAGRFDNIGKRVVLAWNGSREASRATFDALPFLKRAEEVVLFQCYRSGYQAQAGKWPFNLTSDSNEIALGQ